MKKQNWSRDDVVKWLQECACEDELHSINDNNIPTFPYNSQDLSYQVTKGNGVDKAICPETYQKVADTVCQDPYSALQAIQPIMQQIGVGCPQSFAKALFDVFNVGQEMGIIKQFNTE
jgi:hypothetical protein